SVFTDERYAASVGIEKKSAILGSVPKNLNINQQNYVIAGAVSYHQYPSEENNGHYTAFVYDTSCCTKKGFIEFEIQCFKNRFDMVITPYHYLANLLDHRFRGQKLNQDQVEEALEYASSRYPEAMPFIIQYQAKSSPFREYLFSTENIENVSPISWWHSLQNSMNNVMFDLSMQVHTAVASSADIEKLFSTFGFIHSKVRNRLGIEKASKLVTIIKSLKSKNSE
ncbi:hypothetical protein ALC62_10871, partial [Cyphomyrmex costatus]